MQACPNLLTPLHSGPVAPWTSYPTPSLALSAPAQASVLVLTCSRLPLRCLAPLCPLPGALFPRNLPPMIRWILLQCYPFTEPPRPQPPPCFPASSMMNIHLLVGCKLPEGTLTAFPPYPHPPTPASSGHSRSEHPKHKLNKESQNIGTCSFTNINLTTTTNEASTTVIFILYTGKLQHREVKSFTQGHTAVSDPSVCLSVCASSHACVASVMG